MEIWGSVLLGIGLNVFLPAIAVAQDVAAQSGVAHNAPATDEVDAGRRIYLEGILPSGAALTGTRAGGALISGAAAACVSCHRRSGMGQVEGDIQVQPITGNFLYARKEDTQLATMDPHVGKQFNQAHAPYTDTSLANAIVRGINNRGQEMNVAMPRFNLNEPELKALTAYLKQLSSHWSPGVSENNIRFATVITPDVDPVRRKVFVDMLRRAFRAKNGSTEISKAGARHHMVSAAELALGTERNWTLDVWELQGAPDSWAEQLARHYQSHPVFALVSGLSNSTWQPVHDFCDKERIPCWFPSVNFPPATSSEYAFYFSRGVALEADVLARSLLDQAVRPHHVVQIFHDDDVGRTAAHELSQALAGPKIPVEDRVLPAGLTTADALRQVLGKIKPNDAVMYWLRADDMAALDKIKPVPGRSYFSAVLGKAEHAPIPAAWKAKARMVYPYELPEKRAANLTYFHAWLNINKLPLVDEAMQSEVFFSLNYMTDTLSDMLDNLYRDYLLERAEIMLSKRESNKAAQEVRDRVALGRPGDLERRFGAMTAAKGTRLPIANPSDSSASQGTTIYPHLSLGPGQRFASKGGYIVRFSGDKGEQLIAESDWIVP